MGTDGIIRSVGPRFDVPYGVCQACGGALPSPAAAGHVCVPKLWPDTTCAVGSPRFEINQATGAVPL